MEFGTHRWAPVSKISQSTTIPLLSCEQNCAVCQVILYLLNECVDATLTINNPRHTHNKHKKATPLMPQNTEGNREFRD